jgi:hypothetical protein
VPLPDAAERRFSNWRRFNALNKSEAVIVAALMREAGVDPG